jgi:hypothetical protein
MYTDMDTESSASQRAIEDMVLWVSKSDKLTQHFV